jgi:hypothetical protein
MNSCSNCRSSKKRSDNIEYPVWCMRYPMMISVSPTHWCREFEKSEGE